MVIDSSGVLAIFFAEPLGPWASEQLSNANRRLMSTVNLCECFIRIRDRQPAKADLLEDQLLRLSIEFIPPDVAQVQIAARARFQFPLNLGDCFAYALAKTQGLPLLTLDRDFQATDLALVVPPGNS